MSDDVVRVSIAPLRGRDESGRDEPAEKDLVLVRGAVPGHLRHVDRVRRRAGIQGILTVPEIIWELSLGIYPLVCGFKASPILSEEGRPILDPGLLALKIPLSGVPGRASPIPVVRTNGA